MKRVVSRTGIGIVIMAIAMSVVCAALIPYGHPWPSFAWAALACAAAVWVAKASISPSPSMSDVIRDVEAEAPRVSAASEHPIV
jgi:hypothetical protein